ncbi:hypothetical protein K490DRAFT_58435 [Saccharata proteae CBS 121410]|uniref:Uncharacterized protein n=1 Tax=Saccharata proteae CBS 121410 TaxID=1314787 RepID=A0A9P4HSU6_9PEZI|nr:hypothetical protein K490DRAFT_58435 [Saccharata proteae CBS 121410]
MHSSTHHEWQHLQRLFLCAWVCAGVWRERRDRPLLLVLPRRMVVGLRERRKLLQLEAQKGGAGLSLSTFSGSRCSYLGNMSVFEVDQLSPPRLRTELLGRVGRLNCGAYVSGKISGVWGTSVCEDTAGCGDIAGFGDTYAGVDVVGIWNILDMLTALLRARA